MIRLFWHGPVSISISAEGGVSRCFACAGGAIHDGMATHFCFFPYILSAYNKNNNINNHNTTIPPRQQQSSEHCETAGLSVSSGC